MSRDDCTKRYHYWLQGFALRVASFASRDVWDTICKTQDVRRKVQDPRCGMQDAQYARYKTRDATYKMHMRSCKRLWPSNSGRMSSRRATSPLGPDVRLLRRNKRMPCGWGDLVISIASLQYVVNSSLLSSIFVWWLFSPWTIACVAESCGCAPGPMWTHKIRQSAWDQSSRDLTTSITAFYQQMLETLQLCNFIVQKVASRIASNRREVVMCSQVLCYTQGTHDRGWRRDDWRHWKNK